MVGENCNSYKFYAHFIMFIICIKNKPIAIECRYILQSTYIVIMYTFFFFQASPRFNGAYLTVFKETSSSDSRNAPYHCAYCRKG